MTQSIDLVLKASPRAVLEYFEGASEADRRRDSERVQHWHRLWKRTPYGQPTEGVAWSVLCETLPVAVHATATLGELKKAHCWIHDQELLLAIWEQRRPDWLGQWACWSLDQNPVSWRWVRALEVRGWIETPVQESYWLGLIRAADRQGALALLESDPALVPLVWKLFEVEGKGENSLAAFDKYCSEERSWCHALLTLCEQGRLSRSRLLSSSLEALALDFESFRAGWFSRFHEALQPALQERAELARLYAELLASRIRPTQSLAIKALSVLVKAGQVDWTELVRPTVPVAVLSVDKGSALAALKLSLQLPGELGREMAELALEHPHAEVQAAALKALQKLCPRPDASRFQERDLQLAPSLQPLWREWLGQAPQPLISPKPVAVPGPVCETITACGELDEVVQLAARMLESPEPAWEIERLLDGMLRFPRPQSPATQAIAKRARQKAGKADLDHRDLAQTILCWLDSKAQPPEPSKADLRGFLTLRLREVAEALLRGQPRQLLSLPEHSWGGLGEETLRQRLHSSNLTPMRMDLHQARLRASQNPTEAPPDFEVEVTQHGQYTFRRLSLLGKVTGNPDFRDIQSLHRQHTRGGAAVLRWQAMIWPLGREWWASHGLVDIANNLDWWEARWGDRAFLEGLLDPLPWGEHSRLLLAFGLGCKQAEQVGLAVDAALLGLSQGRCSGSQLGQALARAATSGMIKGSRWVRSLGDVARQQASPVWQALQGLTGAAPADFDIGPLLPLFWELCHELRCEVEEPRARARLQAFSGTGKAASLARKLLGLKLSV